MKPKRDADPALTMLTYEQVYDEHGNLRPWIVCDHAGAPRQDVRYEGGVAYARDGSRITNEREERA